MSDIYLHKGCFPNSGHPPQMPNVRTNTPHHSSYTRAYQMNHTKLHKIKTTLYYISKLHWTALDKCTAEHLKIKWSAVHKKETVNFQSAEQFGTFYIASGWLDIN